MESMITILVAGGCTLVSGLMAIGLKLLNNLIKVKVKSENLQMGLLGLTESIRSSVMDVEVTYRQAMSDGILTDKEKAFLKSKVIEAVEHQGADSLKMLASAGMKDLSEFISGQIEEVVGSFSSKKK